MSIASDLMGHTLAGRYQIRTQLGQGGLSAVFLAMDVNLQRPVALKILQPHLSGDEEFRRRFMNEASVMARLDHPHILRIYDFGLDGGRLYLVMEHAGGGSLTRLMKQQPLPDLARVVALVLQVADALAYAHEHGVVHRDIKPSNILLSASGRVLVSDFGLAGLEEGTTLTSIGTTVGTPAYMSPEQIVGKRIDGRSDLYSLGVVLYQLLTGEVPFAGDSISSMMMQHLREPPRPPVELNEEISESLQGVLLKALAKDPDDRYQTAAEFAAALRKAAQLTTDQVTRVVTGSGDRWPPDRLLETMEIPPIREDALYEQTLRQETSAVAWLLALNGAERGKQFRLKDNSVIGRSPECDIVLDYASVSRQHMRISLEDSRFVLYDMGSSNGTMVNGRRVTRYQLQDKDEIRIGQALVLFVQAVGPEDYTPQAKRRLRLFDSLWGGLAEAARDEG